MRTDNNKKNELTSEQVLAWARRVETHRAWKALIQATKESNGFDAVKKEEKNNTLDKAKAGRKETHTRYKYSGNTH